MFTVLERVKTEQVVDVFMTVKSLRIQRAGLLQTLVRDGSICPADSLHSSLLLPVQDQYEFVYRAVLEFLGSFDNYDNFK